MRVTQLIKESNANNWRQNHVFADRIKKRYQLAGYYPFRSPALAWRQETGNRGQLSPAPLTINLKLVLEQKVGGHPIKTGTLAYRAAGFIDKTCLNALPGSQRQVIMEQVNRQQSVLNRDNFILIKPETKLYNYQIAGYPDQPGSSLNYRQPLDQPGALSDQYANSHKQSVVQVTKALPPRIVQRKTDRSQSAEGQRDKVYLKSPDEQPDMVSAEKQPAAERSELLSADYIKSRGRANYYGGGWPTIKPEYNLLTNQIISGWGIKLQMGKSRTLVLKAAPTINSNESFSPEQKLNRNINTRAANDAERTIRLLREQLIEGQSSERPITPTDSQSIRSNVVINKQISAKTEDKSIGPDSNQAYRPNKGITEKQYYNHGGVGEDTPPKPVNRTLPLVIQPARTNTGLAQSIWNNRVIYRNSVSGGANWAFVPNDITYRHTLRSRTGMPHSNRTAGRTISRLADHAFYLQLKRSVSSRPIMDWSDELRNGYSAPSAYSQRGREPMASDAKSDGSPFFMRERQMTNPAFISAVAKRSWLNPLTGFNRRNYISSYDQGLGLYSLSPNPVTAKVQLSKSAAGINFSNASDNYTGDLSKWFKGIRTVNDRRYEHTGSPAGVTLDWAPVSQVSRPLWADNRKSVQLTESRLEGSFREPGTSPIMNGQAINTASIEPLISTANKWSKGKNNLTSTRNTQELAMDLQRLELSKQSSALHSKEALLKKNPGGVPLFSSVSAARETVPTRRLANLAGLTGLNLRGSSQISAAYPAVKFQRPTASTADSRRYLGLTISPPRIQRSINSSAAQSIDGIPGATAMQSPASAQWGTSSAAGSKGYLSLAASWRRIQRSMNSSAGKPIDGVSLATVIPSSAPVQKNWGAGSVTGSRGYLSLAASSRRIQKSMNSSAGRLIDGIPGATVMQSSVLAQQNWGAGSAAGSRGYLSLTASSQRIQRAINSIAVQSIDGIPGATVMQSVAPVHQNWGAGSAVGSRGCLSLIANPRRIQRAMNSSVVQSIDGVSGATVIPGSAPAKQSWQIGSTAVSRGYLSLTASPRRIQRAMNSSVVQSIDGIPGTAGMKSSAPAQQNWGADSRGYLKLPVSKLRIPQAINKFIVKPGQSYVSSSLASRIGSPAAAPLELLDRASKESNLIDNYGVNFKPKQNIAEIDNRYPGDSKHIFNKNLELSAARRSDTAYTPPAERAVIQNQSKQLDQAIYRRGVNLSLSHNLAGQTTTLAGRRLNPSSSIGYRLSSDSWLNRSKGEGSIRQQDKMEVQDTIRNNSSRELNPLIHSGASHRKAVMTADQLVQKPQVYSNLGSGPSLNYRRESPPTIGNAHSERDSRPVNVNTELKMQLPAAREAELNSTEIKKIADRVFREVQQRMKLERQHRGL